MVDYTRYITAAAIPEASSMIETFRAIGYNLETAVADIIDNCISAGAKNIWINFEWNGANTWISIEDDGKGMNNDELIQAMKPGSKNPLYERSDKDLGRFGLGLKTASFSQARKLSVISKKENFSSIFWTWDLDFVNQTGKWELIKYLPDGNYKKEINDKKSGTIVIWNDIDRVVKDLKKDNNKALDKFMIIMEIVKKHLAMVFHRFIEHSNLNIYFQDNKIISWNPFLIDEQATQIFPEEKLHNGKVILKGFVLPHKSKISEEKYKIAEGTKGWNEHQGFYIYRNERLLLIGDWLGLFRKEEHYKLTRIQIDLPNTLDEEWQIDIKKSIARPPFVLRDSIKAYATEVRGRAVEVYRHRGRNIHTILKQKFVPIWLEHKKNDKWYYKINREHPLIEKIKIDSKLEPEKSIELLIRFIEETIPTKSIYIKEAEEPELQGKPFQGNDNELIRDTMIKMYNNLLNAGKTTEQAKSIIIHIEPFNHFTHLLELLN